MGTLTYDSTLKADFEDRALTHIRLVIGTKLRRNEAFFLSWKDDTSIGNGRSTIWLHPAIPLLFKFHGSRDIPINLRWIEDLTLTANSANGLRVVPEPDPNSRSTVH